MRPILLLVMLLSIQLAFSDRVLSPDTAPAQDQLLPCMSLSTSTIEVLGQSLPVCTDIMEGDRLAEVVDSKFTCCECKSRYMVVSTAYYWQAIDDNMCDVGCTLNDVKPDNDYMPEDGKCTVCHMRPLATGATDAFTYWTQIDAQHEALPCKCDPSIPDQADITEDGELKTYVCVETEDSLGKVIRWELKGDEPPSTDIGLGNIKLEYTCNAALPGRYMILQQSSDYHQTVCFRCDGSAWLAEDCTTMPPPHNDALFDINRPNPTMADEADRVCNAEGKYFVDKAQGGGAAAYYKCRKISDDPIYAWFPYDPTSLEQCLFAASGNQQLKKCICGEVLGADGNNHVPPFIEYYDRQGSKESDSLKFIGLKDSDFHPLNFDMIRRDIEDDKDYFNDVIVYHGCYYGDIVKDNFLVNALRQFSGAMEDFFVVDLPVISEDVRFAVATSGRSGQSHMDVEFDFSDTQAISGTLSDKSTFCKEFVKINLGKRNFADECKLEYHLGEDCRTGIFWDPVKGNAPFKGPYGMELDFTPNVIQPFASRYTVTFEWKKYSMDGPVDCEDMPDSIMEKIGNAAGDAAEEVLTWPAKIAQAIKDFIFGLLCPSLYSNSDMRSYEGSPFMGVFSKDNMHDYLIEMTQLDSTKLSIRNIGTPETEYVDQLVLLEVPDAQDMTLASGSGEIIALDDIREVSCTIDGEDCSQAVRSSDADLYHIGGGVYDYVEDEKVLSTSMMPSWKSIELDISSARDGDYLIYEHMLSRKVHSYHAFLFAAAGNLPVKDAAYSMLRTDAGDLIADRIFDVLAFRAYYLDEGVWTEFPGDYRIASSDSNTRALRLSEDVIEGGKIRIEFLSGTQVFDMIAIASGEELPVIEHRPISATVGDEDFVPEVSSADNDYATIRHKESLDVAFGNVFYPESRYFLKARGYYLPE